MTDEIDSGRFNALGISNVVLQQVIERLVAIYEPRKIYLYGSCARGEATRDSDIDLAVIVPDDASPERQRAGSAYPALFEFHAPVELTIWRESYFAEKLRVPTSLPATIIKEGTELYAA